MLRPIIAALGALAAVCACAGPAFAFGDARAGEILFSRSCTSCHAPASAKVGTDAAPTLSHIAEIDRQNPASVRDWLMAPHPPMSGIALSRQQIDDIVAYLNTLPGGK